MHSSDRWDVYAAAGDSNSSFPLRRHPNDIRRSSPNESAIKEKKKGEKKVSEDELVNRIAELEEQVTELKKTGKSLSAIEQARKRIFGIVRDGMASEGGKIVG